MVSWGYPVSFFYYRKTLCPINSLPAAGGDSFPTSHASAGLLWALLLPRREHIVFREVSCRAAVWSGLHFLEYVLFFHHQCLGFSLFFLSLPTSSASKRNDHHSISAPLQEVALLWDPNPPTHNLIFAMMTSSFLLQ